MSDVTIDFVEDPVKLKGLNYTEPVLSISTPYSFTIIPKSQICYREIKRVVTNAKERVNQIESMDAFRDTDNP
jgi:hypothetical protein